eukprot:2792446-Prymnesium_polylepis.1
MCICYGKLTVRVGQRLHTDVPQARVGQICRKVSTCRTSNGLNALRLRLPHWAGTWFRLEMRVVESRSQGTPPQLWCTQYLV